MEGIWAPADPAGWEELLPLYRMVVAGEVSVATARRLVAEAPWKSAARTATEAATLAVDLATADSPHHAHTLADLGLAIARQARERRREQALAYAMTAFVTTAAEVLVELPDPAVLRRAREVDRQLLDAAASGAHEGSVLAAVGAARLAPYACSPAYDTYAAQMAEWRLGRSLRDGEAAGHVDQTDPTQGLRDALEPLERAATLLSGRARAGVLVDLAHTRFTQWRNGETVDLEGVVRDCVTAWPRSRSTFDRFRLVFMLATLGALKAVGPYRIALTDGEAILTAEGPRRAAWIAIVVIKFHANLNRALCRSLRAEMLARLPNDRLEAERCWLEQIGAHLLESDPYNCERITTLPLFDLTAPDRPGQADVTLHRFAHAPAEEASDRPEQHEERVLGPRRPSDTDRARLVSTLLALRLARRAAHHHQTGDHSAAGPLFVRAAELFGRLGFRRRALAALCDARRSLVAGPPEAAATTLAELRGTSDRLLAQLAGTSVAEQLRLLYGQAFTRVSEWAPASTRESEKLEIVALAMQLAKGRSFAAATSQAGPRPDDEFMAGHLDRMAAVERAEADVSRLADGQPGPLEPVVPHQYGESVLFDDEALLGATWHPRESDTHDGPTGVIANLRQRYQLLDQLCCVIDAAVADRPSTVGELTAALPRDAALVAFYYWGVGEPPRRGFHCLVATTDMVTYLAVHDPEQPAVTLARVMTRGQDHDASTGVVHAEPAVHTAHLRRRLLDDPLYAVASREAREALADCAAHYQPVLDLLATLRESGHSHLLLWPHGAQYLLPFQLVPTGNGRIVADDWTVTVVPSLAFVTGTRSETARTDMVALACPSGGPADDPRDEPDLVAQAHDLARAFGTLPLSSATRDEFRRNAPGARYLHIAGHGAIYHPAPLFHHVHLADGPLYAHEVLKLDLRSVELVTVSACESALVRLDENDNLLGLPAAFLRAGASAVVGALWPITPEVATDFFTTLYHRLAAGARKLDAFRIAQTRTRERHPQYRDWGAFSMLGDWR